MTARPGRRSWRSGLDFAQEAFSRTPEDPFAGPFLGSNAAYVIALNKKIPSEIPPLDQIRRQVVEDFQDNQALNLARQAGMEFYQRLTNGLAQGKTPAAVCAEAKLKPDTTCRRSPSAPARLPEVEDRIALNQFKQHRVLHAAGKASAFQMTPTAASIRPREGQAAAGRGENERRPARVHQLCPPEPAKRGL